MADYISRDDALLHSEIIRVYSKDYGNIDVVPVEYLADIPAADVQPVKHGRWIILDDVEHFIAVCSECGRTEDSRDIKNMPYCHCGAKMDGGAENEPE